MSSPRSPESGSKGRRWTLDPAQFACRFLWRSHAPGCAWCCPIAAEHVPHASVWHSKQHQKQARKFAADMLWRRKFASEEMTLDGPFPTQSAAQNTPNLNCVNAPSSIAGMSLSSSVNASARWLRSNSAFVWMRSNHSWKASAGTGTPIASRGVRRRIRLRRAPPGEAFASLCNPSVIRKKYRRNVAFMRSDCATHVRNRCDPTHP